jgi:hypothetical protein
MGHLERDSLARSKAEFLLHSGANLFADTTIILVGNEAGALRKSHLNLPSAFTASLTRCEAFRRADNLADPALWAGHSPASTWPQGGNIVGHL